MTVDVLQSHEWQTSRNAVQRALHTALPGEAAFVVRRHASSGRHDLYVAANAAGRRVFIKAGNHLEAERWISAHLTHPTIPPGVPIDSTRMVATEAIENPLTLEEIRHRSPTKAIELLADLGRFLRWLHAQDASSSPTARRRESLPRIDPIPIDIWLQLTDAARDVVRWVQSRPRVAATYESATTRAEPSGLINADLKPDNILYSNGTLMVVDWELAGVGPVGLDIGAALGSILIAWLQAPASPDGSDNHDFTHQLMISTARFRAEYCGWGAEDDELNSEILAEWTAAWLIGRTFAEASRVTALSPRLLHRLQLIEIVLNDHATLFRELPR